MTLQGQAIISDWCRIEFSSRCSPQYQTSRIGFCDAGAHGQKATVVICSRSMSITMMKSGVVLCMMTTNCSKCWFLKVHRWIPSACSSWLHCFNLGKQLAHSIQAIFSTTVFHHRWAGQGQMLVECPPKCIRLLQWFTWRSQNCRWFTCCVLSPPACIAAQLTVLKGEWLPAGSLPYVGTKVKPHLLSDHNINHCQLGKTVSAATHYVWHESKIYGLSMMHRWWKQRSGLRNSQRCSIVNKLLHRCLIQGIWIQHFETLLAGNVA